MVRLGVLLAALAGAPVLAAAATPDPAAPPPRSMSFSLRAVPAESRGPLPYELVRGLIVFKMAVNGKEALAILDTGASRSIVDLNFALANGLAVSSETQTGTTPNGTITVRLVDNVSIALPGQFEGSLPQIGALDLASVQANAGRNI